MQGRTVILVSHHVQLCAPGASFVVSLDNGSVSYSGSASEFLKSGVDEDLLKDDPQDEGVAADDLVEDVAPLEADEEEKATPAVVVEKRGAPRKLIEDEQRATGRISRDVWALYLKSCVASLCGLLRRARADPATASPGALADAAAGCSGRPSASFSLPRC